MGHRGCMRSSGLEGKGMGATGLPDSCATRASSAPAEGVVARSRRGATRQPGRPPDLVDRNFAAKAPNQLWVADITFVPTAAGFLYLAVVLDAWSRRIVGWSMANHLRTELVLDPLQLAIGQ